ncbi:glutathione-dependent formaldehyde-activating GFA [Annulohypoxylon maeteangense]|uniref:glutathione-dependent formaldehyde-activating GFA n=1 Tax=Annulohypoxylon maeteangense TaxID=1927788 RepID=UPI002008673D|nr:glutathione-dependent formaldehyde-activating GFA [Annulohypoxylon maeteangense]KAI0885951.1 glutathione-dependent formaldehyde-activating GFA [Annulohypoxylon maeteangense]
MSRPTPDNFPKPKSITGGCLCGALRYKVDFPDDHDFLKQSSSCQCTQCRRNTGTLFLVAHTTPLSGFTFLTPTTTLKKFSATPGFQRAFCANCGGFLYWRDESLDEVAVAVGTVDPEYLSKYGFALASASDNLWCENEIKGVTDVMIGKERGIRWARSSEEGVKM